MFKTDQPINSLSEDLLEREVFINAVSDALLSYNDTESLSVGLYGKWGLGKTSTINLILEDFKEKLNDAPHTYSPIIFKFNPWNFSNQDQLIKQFFEQLGTAIGRKEHGKNAEKVSKKLSLYSKLVLPLSMVPQLTVPALFLSKLFDLVGKGTATFSQNAKNDLALSKATLNDALIKLNRRVFIIIDDIDRLNNVEICQIFQLVKSLGDFNNTLYILSLDKDIVSKALQKVQEGKGLEYLEKVIQVPFELPEVSIDTIHKVLFKRLDEVLGKKFEERFDKYYWGEVYRSGIKHLFQSIRDINRYMNILKFELPVVQNEVDPVDFIAITAIKTFIPELYNEIRNNKDLFTGNFAYNNIYDKSGKNEKEEIVEKCNYIFEKHTDKIPKYLLELLKVMFPKINGAYGNVVIHSDKNYRKDGHICSPHCFPIYFRLTVQTDEISREDMLFYITQTSSKDAFASVIKQLIKDEKLFKFFDRFEDYIIDDVPIDNIENVLFVFMDIGDSFPENKDDSFLSLGSEMNVYWLFQRLLNRFNTQDERFEILKRIIVNCHNSIYTITYNISVQGQEHGKNSQKTPRPESERTVTSEQLVELEEMCLNKIKEWLNTNDLIKHKNFLGVLYRWKDWGIEEEVYGYVDSAIQNDEGLITLLERSLGKVTTSVPPYSYYELKLDDIKNFIPLEKISERILQINKSDKFEDLSSEAKNAITQYVDKQGVNGGFS
jgi:predicted KAP-like P-loop ATPase